MKKTDKQTTKELKVKKVTLRDLDEPTLDAMAGGRTDETCPTGLLCKTTLKSA